MIRVRGADRLTGDLSSPQFRSLSTQAGRYESFYLKLADPPASRGAWIRYTVLKRPGEVPCGSLWCTLWTGDGPPHACKVTLPPHALSAGPGELVGIGESRLTPSSLGSDFFGALFDRTMKGTYSHPVYAGNQGYAAWKAFGFAGDVHGVRYSQVDTSWTSSSLWLPTDPSTGQGAWAIYGGYAPDEMNGPGTAATEQPNGGCVNAFGISSGSVDPWPGS